MPGLWRNSSAAAVGLCCKTAPHLLPARVCTWAHPASCIACSHLRTAPEVPNAVTLLKCCRRCSCRPTPHPCHNHTHIHMHVCTHVKSFYAPAHLASDLSRQRLMFLQTSAQLRHYYAPSCAAHMPRFCARALFCSALLGLQVTWQQRQQEQQRLPQSLRSP